LDEIYYEKILNRIIQGRLRIRLGDLVLFIHEPSAEILEESFEIYDQAYKRAYFSGCYTEQEVLSLLIDYDMWTPFDDKEVEAMDKKLEELKVNAYKAFFKKKELSGIKRLIRMTEMDRAITAHKKKQFDHITCSGVANFTRRAWILQQTTKTIDGKNYDFLDVNIQTILEEYSASAIDPTTFRKIARTSPWRQMWNSSKKRGDVFGKSSVYLDQNQLALISYSQMYDSVYENPESPKEEVIDDDDCLDGWFIEQRRKHEKDKIKQQTEDLISNPKIKNSQEIFVMANSQEEAQDVYSLNNDAVRTIIKQRQEEIKSTSGLLNHKELPDVKQERMLNAVNTARSAIKSKGR
jgi:hypothetical protein